MIHMTVALLSQSMIRKSGYRFSLATNMEGVCAEIMLNHKEMRS
jgi:hypothetical protein